MANFGIGEIYGFPLRDTSEAAKATREAARCPFKGGDCSKKGGVCTLTDGSSFPIVCPQRFRQGNVLFDSIAELAFGAGKRYVVLSEIPFLEATSKEDTRKHVGNIDNILVELDDESEIVDWCALEVQAVYFSGTSMGKEIKSFLEEGIVREPASRRPDFRSSGPKRLLPQLETKMPTLRRWGKKMFVAIDKPFLDWLPSFREENDLSNADICWLSFELDTNVTPYRIALHSSHYATLESSREGLVAGAPPPKSEFEDRVLKAIRADSKIIYSN